MNKKILKEDIKKMMTLINYDRSKTLSEQITYDEYEDVKGTPEIEDEKSWSNASKADVAAGLIAWGGLAAAKTSIIAAGGSALVSTGGLILVPLAIGAIVYGLWKWGDYAFGSKNVSKQMGWALNRDSWDEVIETMEKQEKALHGKDLSNLYDVISKKKAKRYANDFHTYFNDPEYWSNTDEEGIEKIFKRCDSFLDVARISDKYGRKDGYTLEYELDDELSTGAYTEYVEDPMKGKPILIFNGVKCFEIKQYVKELTKVVVKMQEEIATQAGLTLDQARGKAPVEKEKEEKIKQKETEPKDYGSYKILECNAQQILEGCIAKVGHGGKMVKAIQTLLKNAKIPLLKHGVDGKYGTETYNAVIEFQKKIFPNNKGEWDGRVGPSTMKQLIKYK